MKLQGLKRTHNSCNSIGLVTIIYQDYELNGDIVLKHVKHYKNDSGIFEIKAKKGDKVQLMYQEKSKKVKWIISKGLYSYSHSIDKSLEYMIEVMANNKKSFDPATYRPIMK